MYESGEAYPTSAPPPRPPVGPNRGGTLPPRSTLSSLSSPPTSPSELAPTPALPGLRASTLPHRMTLPPEPPAPVTASMNKRAFVFGNISRKEAEQTLRDAGLVDGLFLLRKRDGDAAVALSLFAMPDVYEHHIVNLDTATGIYTLNGEPMLVPCFSLEDVMAHLRRVPDRIGVPLGKIVGQ